MHRDLSANSKQASYQRIEIQLIGIILLLTAGIVECRTQALAQNATWIRQSGFETFHQGKLGDGGANLYVSHRGRIEAINRWDLNRDGELDLLFTQDHNNVYAPASLIYWGGPQGYRSLLPDMWQLRAPFSLLTYWKSIRDQVTMLPTQGGGRARVVDLNGDGFPDIVFCNYMHNYRTDQSAYIYWGGAFGFKAAARTQLSAYLAEGVAVGDLNGDGLPDIVLANHGNEEGELLGFRLNRESYIYWGNATGYSARHRTSIPTISAADVATGDFNGDGHPDLAFVNSNSREQSVYIYWGDGTGKFTESRRQILTSADLHSSKDAYGHFTNLMKTLLAANLNGDRFTDLVVAGAKRGLVFYGGANGLSDKPALELPAKNCLGMQAADLNGDGFSDLIFANAGGTNSPPPPSTIFWGSDRGFNPDHRLNLPTLGAASVSVADLNHDGFPDILFGNSHEKDKTDVPSYIYWGSRTGFEPYKRSELLGFGTVGTAIADLNKDGKPDIVLVGHLSGTTAPLPSVIFWGNRDHYYSSASTTLLRPGGLMKYSVADLDDDGYPDLVFLYTNNQPAAIWWGSPKGYSAANRTLLPARDALSSSIADLNRDGFLDIVFTIPAPAGRKHAKAIIVWGNSERFKHARTTEIELSSPGTEANTIADLNHDGYLDLIFPLFYGNYSEIWYGGPNGYQAKNRKLIPGYGLAYATVADLDNDGWLDLIMGDAQKPGSSSPDDNTFIYWGGPNGFSQQHRTALQSYTSLDATVGDFNHDGHLDIALDNYKSETRRDLPAFIYWGGVGRNFSDKHRSFLPLDSSNSSVVGIDLNRDGWLDLVVSNHQRHFDHAAGTDIFWGGPQGFSFSRSTHLPTVGVHLNRMVDPGNIYNRKYEWAYTSTPIEAPAGTTFSRIEWKANTDFGTGVKFQVRTAATQEGLKQQSWTGPSGAATYYTSRGSELHGMSPHHRWLQYRAVLTSPSGGNSAILTEVGVECVR